MFDLTGGAFDVSIGTGLPSLEFDPDDFTVRATARGVRLDLGGIGKGYAVDLMAEVLEDWGLTAALVHGGFSSVLALEPPADGEGWPLTLSDPAAPVTRPRAIDGAPDGAGRVGRAQTGSHRGPAHRRARARAPRGVGDRAAPARPAADGSGEPRHRLAAAAVTDALTTACMLLPHGEIEALCRSTAGLEAWILEDARRCCHFGID